MTSRALTVILPLVDDRGFGEAALASWIGQPDADSFEIIAVGNDPSSQLVRRARQLARPEDRVLVLPGMDEIELYRAGGEAAATELLLFTESHCIAEPGAARALVDLLRRTDAAAAMVSGRPMTSNAFAQFETRLFEEGLRQHPGDDWRWVGLRGLAIRRDAWERAGKFETSCGRLAESILAVRVGRMGGRIEVCPDARVRHGNCSRMRDLFAALHPSGRGQAEWRRRCEAGLEEEFLPPLAEWSERARWNRRIAAAAAGLHLRIGGDEAMRGQWRRAAARLRPLVGSGFRAVLGSRGVRCAAGVRAGWFLSSSVLRPSAEGRYRAYSRASSELLRWGVLDRVDGSLPPAPATPQLRPSELPDGVFAGFHAAERFSADEPRPSCRWTRPFAMMRLGHPPADYRLSLDVRSPVPLERLALRLFWNGYRLEGSVEDGFAVPKEAFRRGEQLLAFDCTPFHPQRVGLPDTRELGVAVFALTLERIAGPEGPS